MDSFSITLLVAVLPRLTQVYSQCTFSGCEAKCWVDKGQETGEVEQHHFTNSHNHLPLANPQLHPE
jgi:hypothetical protein